MLLSLAFRASALPTTIRVGSWHRFAPGYVAYRIDQLSPQGPFVFIGHEVPMLCETPAALLDQDLFWKCMQAQVQSQNCQSVGCHLYFFDPKGNGTARKLASEQISSNFQNTGTSFGFIDVALSNNGKRNAAIGINGADSRAVSHAWTVSVIGGSKPLMQSFKGFVSSCSAFGLAGFLSGAGQGRLLRSLVGGFQEIPGASNCAIYRASAHGPLPVVTGFSGTFRLSSDLAVAERIGPPGEAVWVSKNGTFIAIAVTSSSGSDARIQISRDGGKSWIKTPFDDASRKDSGSEARFIVGEIAGTGADDLWAVGGRRDKPAARVWKLSSANKWVRDVMAPDSSYPYSDLLVLERGHPIVAGLNGIYRLS